MLYADTKLAVVTTTDLADIARQVGGDYVFVECLSTENNPNQTPYLWMIPVLTILVTFLGFVLSSQWDLPTGPFIASLYGGVAVIYFGLSRNR
jgi:hypothetical protein